MIKVLGIGLVFFLLFELQRVIYEKLWHKQLTVEIQFSQEHIFQGEQGELKEMIENQKRLPLPMLKVKFKTDRNLCFGSSTEGSRTTDQFYRNDMFRMNGKEKITRTLRFTGSKRGYYVIDNASLVATDLFLSNQMVSEVSFHTALYVYPKPYAAAKLQRSLTALNGEVLSKRHLLEDPFEYRGIREYQPFDTMHSINWKATAKTGELKVNQKNYTSLKAIRIFFNVEDDNILQKEACVEASLQIVAGLSSFFLRQGMMTSCYGNGLDILTKEPLRVEAKAGAGQFDTICRKLARLDLKQPAASFTEQFAQCLFSGAKDTVTCFVAPNQYDDFVSLLEKYQEAGNSFLWYYPVLGKQEPALPETLRNRVCFLHLDN